MWAMVTLLAVAGFAAFQIGGRDAPVHSTADLGRAVGALAAVGFSNATAAGEVLIATATTEDGSTGSTASAPSDEPAPIDTIPTNGWLSEMQVRALVVDHFQPEDVNRAIRVMWCESSFNPTSHNPQTGATGLFQHLPEFWERRAEAAGFGSADPADPEANIAAAAYAIYEEGGWDVFACAP